MEPRMAPEDAAAALATMSDADFPTVDASEEVDDAQAERLIEAGHRTRGRPSLTGKGERSPQITLRLPEPLRQRLKERAEEDCETESEIARRALEQYLGPAA